MSDLERLEQLLKTTNPWKQKEQEAELLEIIRTSGPTLLSRLREAEQATKDVQADYTDAVEKLIATEARLRELEAAAAARQELEFNSLVHIMPEGDFPAYRACFGVHKAMANDPDTATLQAYKKFLEETCESSQ